ncbi:MAG: PRTRC system protein C [Dehalococcoidia bacterium]|nr:MAG: PRTRC system protein C [Dehalococcoidia bacterium]
MAKRVFVYEGREFPDPDPNKSVEEVKQVMSDFFPELANAEVKEAKRDEDTIYEFVKKVGVKG